MHIAGVRVRPSSSILLGGEVAAEVGSKQGEFPRVGMRSYRIIISDA